jgi:hypothetical protein
MAPRCRSRGHFDAARPDLTRPSELGEPGGGVDGGAEHVAAPPHDRASRHADVHRRQRRVGGHARPQPMSAGEGGLPRGRHRQHGVAHRVQDAHPTAERPPRQGREPGRDGGRGLVAHGVGERAESAQVGDDDPDDRSVSAPGADHSCTT